ncbi:MAG: GNAT family N-acetyltransferase [Ktedonobacteraceae bacterium]
MTHQQKLLVFSHPHAPEAGIQVPAGTVEVGESPEQAVLREAFEETGLTGLILAGFLGEQEYDMADFGRDEIHQRFFYHLRYEGEPPAIWQHEERFTSDGSGPHLFEFFWATLPHDMPSLIADHDLMLPQLLKQLKSGSSSHTSIFDKKENRMQPTPNTSYRRNLGDGLVLRWSTADDTERIATLHGMVHRDNAEGPPNLNIMKVVRRLMNGDHPFMGPHDFGVIEDTSKEGNPVVACTCLWKHTWTYEGIPFSVGQPEMVATDPAYRNRGLIRVLFEMVHKRSEAEGDLVQAITGIPYFYRQFGYEYALELEDRRFTPIALIPQAKEGEPEPLRLREATGMDIPTIVALFSRRRESYSVSASIPHTQWLYEIETWKEHPQLGRTFHFQMIVNTTGQTVGFTASDNERQGKSLRVWLLEFAEGVNVQTAMPSVLRALHAYGLSLEPAQLNAPPLSAIGLFLDTTHPVHTVLSAELDHAREPPYAWYLRVKDLPALLMHITPVLERRLATSPVAGYTGECKLDFYRGGLRLVFEQGRLTVAEHWHAPLYGSTASGGFPPLVFLQVLFGYRSIEALRHVFPDVWISDEAMPVLKVLFPTRPSFVCSWL